MSDSPLIAQPGHQKMTLLRESYQAICDNDPCAARLLNAMERWHLHKLRARDEVRGRNRARRQGGLKASGDEDLWVRMAIDTKDARSLGWRAELMNEYSYKVVQRALDLLVAKGFTAKRDNPRQNWDRTPQWLFQVQAVQQAVDDWGLSRENPGMDDDPDGNAATPESGANAAADGSARLADSTRQIDRMDAAQQPNQIGPNTESSRQIDRSNSTEILLQESLSDIPQQTSPSPELVSGAPARQGPDDDGSAVAEKDQAPQPTLEGDGDLPFFGDDQTGGPGIRLDSGLDGPEKVPPGGPALLTLVPVPRDVLERRPPRDPLTLTTLRTILKASHASRAAHLHASLALATHSGVPRELLTRLTESEIGRAIAAARADTPLDQTGQGFDRMVALALEVLIGEPVTAEMIAKGRQKPLKPGETLGPSSRVLNGGQACQSTAPEKAASALDLSTRHLGHWVLKTHPDQAVEVTHIEERPGQTPLLHLRGGNTLSITEINLKYLRPAVSAETGRTEGHEPSPTP